MSSRSLSPRLAADPRSRAGVVAAIIAAIVAAFGVDRLRTSLTNRLYKVHEIDDVYPLPPPQYVKRLALGYDDAAVSILWASLLYQYGEHVNQKRRFTYSTQYLRTILRFNPRFLPAFQFGPTFLTMQTVTADHDEVVALKEILREGTIEMPSNPDVVGAYATFLLFEAAPYLSESERAAWRKEGALVAVRAGELGFMGGDFGEAGAAFLEKQGDLRLALQQLERAYPVAPNDDVRDRIVRRMERIRAALGQAEKDHVIEAEHHFVKTWNEEAGFVGESLFDLTGPRRDVAACAGKENEPRCASAWGSFAK